MLRVHLVELFVDDQDKARAFYTEKLGFEVETDAAYGDGRWLAVVAPDDPDGPRVVLTKADDLALERQSKSRSTGTPIVSLRTDDCQATYETLRDRGVTFVMEPTTYEYGGTDAVLDDTCGNLVNLHQA